MEELLEAYLNETQAPVSIEELATFSQHLLPLRLEKDLVGRDGTVVMHADEISGFVGLDEVTSDKYDAVAIIKMVYIVPKARRSFKIVVRNIFQFLYDQGFRTVEIHSTRKIHNWINKHLGSKPTTYVHLGSLEEYLRRLDN